MKKSKILLTFSVLILVLARFYVFPKEAAAQNPYYVDPSIVSVTLPAWITFTIDPFEVNNRGQVYSNYYVIENVGDADVFIDFTDIRLQFANDWDFESLTYPFDDWMQSDRKSIYLSLDFGRFDVSPATLTDFYGESRLGVPLDSPKNNYGSYSSELSLSLSGNVNAPLNSLWQPGDVRIAINYTIRLAEPEPQATETPYPD